MFRRDTAREAADLTYFSKIDSRCEEILERLSSRIRIDS
jgi:hypothetical protein